ncbi:MAG TPA: radical SAM protein [Acidobacteriota bacterium]|jgi:radical SAM superfamily enzyme YgiQ (UPF0313 family)|nr:radical SAM protein [Acidobacteriota bacterium]
MRVVLADLKGRNGFVNKDTVVGGFGSRFRGFSATTRIIEAVRKLYQNLPSIHVGYLASIFAQAGHDVRVTNSEIVGGDLALILSSLVDYRHEIEWSREFRQQCGKPIGFFGALATHMSDVLADHADFVIKGEPDHAAMRLAQGESLKGIVVSPAINDLDSLPFPRWDLVSRKRFGYSTGRSVRPARATFPLLSSRSCPEHCTYCPHRITAAYRSRSPENVLAEIESLCRKYGKVDFVLRDPLFTEERERSRAIAEGIIRKNLPVHFECETRLDNLDTDLIDFLHRAGLLAITFGVESVDPAILKRVARRPIPTEHQKQIVNHCRKKGISTGGFYVIGFLTDTMESVRATIDYSIELNTTGALYKILTPYPGTPLRKQMESLIVETDLEKFDGYTPTFRHPNLTHEQLLFLLRSAFARFYFRPSWLGNYLGVQNHVAQWMDQWDAYAQRRHSEMEMPFLMSLQSGGVPSTGFQQTTEA